ncbi:MAG: glutathione S-transferase family protein [Alphaproteobacteria bacterium]|nr:glutathione S-transferase family protein [Alphaproteobacteria bacterium]
MTVYGASVSPFVRKVLVVLEEKKLAYSHMPLGPHDQRDEFKSASPLGKIPALRDGDFAIADSMAIVSYIDRRYPQSPVYPESAEDAARAVWFEKFADTELGKPILTYGFQTFFGPRFFNHPTDQALADNAIKVELPPLLDYLETVANEPFLVASRCTVADIAVASMFMTLQMAGQTVDAGRWPKLQHYVAGIQGRPSFKLCAELDRKMLAATG